MTVCTDESNDGLTLLLRRTGATAGFLFGFGLLAVVMANNASADDRRPGDEGPLQGTVESVTGLLSPLTSTAEPVLEPVTSVVDYGIGMVAPAVAPIVEVAEPVTTTVLQPVIATVTPITGSAVTEPIGGPPSNAADPPAESAPTAPSPSDTVPAGASAPETTPPQRMPQPTQTRDATAALAAVSEATQWPDSSYGDGGHASAASVRPAQVSGSGGPGGTPWTLGGPANAFVGGGGAAGGSGGSHGADAALSVPGYPPGHNDSGGRSPPDSIGGQPWFAYDNRDHPS
jgi:uncharacterized membrane protein YgcG